MNEIQKFDGGGAVDIRRKPVDIEALLVAAMEKGPDVVERMMVVRRELNAERAKAEFDAALAAFQTECPPIPKGKNVRDSVGTTLYHYAPFESILAIVKPVMRKHGLSFTLDTDTDSKDGWVIATCKVTHTAGHAETSKAKFPLGTGTRAMSVTQVFAAALSFASRRVFCNALGIVTVGEDFDGSDNRQKQKAPGQKAAPEPEKPTQPTAEELRKKLWAVLEPVRGETWDTAKVWLAAQNICPKTQRIGAMTADELAVVLEKAELALKDLT